MTTTIENHCGIVDYLILLSIVNEELSLKESHYFDWLNESIEFCLNSTMKGLVMGKRIKVEVYVLAYL